MRLCVIPARGGSKRIPCKNIRPFAGKPMIAYAIETARESSLFDRIIVSSDNEEIMRIARHLGADTPFRRPAELSDDHAPTAPVVAHAVRECEGDGFPVDDVCCIYPCVPFLQVSDLSAGLTMLHESRASFCFPIAEFPSAIQRALRLGKNGRVSSFQSVFEVTRTQDLEPAYYDAGQFYWGTRDAWLHETRVHLNGAGLIIPSWRVVDIDTPMDWTRAEKLWHVLTPKGGTQVGDEPNPTQPHEITSL
jgi:pseudaminic acid cytidylyltransferase